MLARSFIACDPSRLLRVGPLLWMLDGAVHYNPSVDECQEFRAGMGVPRQGFLAGLGCACWASVAPRVFRRTRAGAVRWMGLRPGCDALVPRPALAHTHAHLSLLPPLAHPHPTAPSTHVTPRPYTSPTPPSRSSSSFTPQPRYIAHSLPP
ncbi:hypothetical protein CALCODRAFT_195965 [Calocera cornea HHB12733]|uniref:Uncharacterized protein n=1 Tax=Calocera cornea HHB12733 TaxID=1353952 RepID=A0A165HJW8_9BASI|nr:hypothetical protein CALCODRAFT_195965 [Calocera cornea HHB12733]